MKWLQVIQAERLPDKLLPYFYLCNDVVQKCNRPENKSSAPFVEFFASVLPHALAHTLSIAPRRSSVYQSLLRLLGIWKSRHVFPDVDLRSFAQLFGLSLDQLPDPASSKQSSKSGSASASSGSSGASASAAGARAGATSSSSSSSSPSPASSSSSSSSKQSHKALDHLAGYTVTLAPSSLAQHASQLSEFVEDVETSLSGFQAKLNTLRNVGTSTGRSRDAKRETELEDILQILATQLKYLTAQSNLTNALLQHVTPATSTSSTRRSAAAVSTDSFVASPSTTSVPTSPSAAVNVGDDGAEEKTGTKRHRSSEASPASPAPMAVTPVTVTPVAVTMAAFQTGRETPPLDAVQQDTDDEG